jgi:hypothetical protein
MSINPSDQGRNLQSAKQDIVAFFALYNRPDAKRSVHEFALFVQRLVQSRHTAGATTPTEFSGAGFHAGRKANAPVLYWSSH